VGSVPSVTQMGESGEAEWSEVDECIGSLETMSMLGGEPPADEALNALRFTCVISNVDCLFLLFILMHLIFDLWRFRMGGRRHRNFVSAW
jgi:hypothetical protein